MRRFIVFGALLWALLDPASVLAQPVNDICPNATAIVEGVYAFDNTTSIADGPNDCDPNLSFDVWFNYTANQDGVVQFEVCNGVGTLQDSVMIVYDASLGCPTAGSPSLDCDDDSCGPSTFGSRVTIPVLIGNSYYIQIGGWNGELGSAELVVILLETDCANGLDDDGDGLGDCADPDCAADPACNTAPANDDCLNAIPVTDGATSYDATGASGGTDLSGICDVSALGDDIVHRSLWFSYTATKDGLLHVDTLGTGVDTRLAAYATGDCTSIPGSVLACDDGLTTGAPFEAKILFEVTMGETYLIELGGSDPGADIGAGTLNIVCAGLITLFEYTGGPCPPNTQVLLSDPGNVECGVERSRLVDANSPLDGTMADAASPGPDDPTETGLLFRLDNFAVDNAGLVAFCLQVTIPATPPTFRQVIVKTREAAVLDISDEAKDVIDGGRRNYWAKQARREAVLSTSLDPDDQEAASRIRRQFQKKNNQDYATLLDGTNYMRESCTTTMTTEIIPGTPGSTFSIYFVFQGDAFDSLGRFYSELTVQLTDVPTDPNGSPFLGNTEDFALIIENIDDTGPAPVTDFSGALGTGDFDVTTIDLNDPNNRNPQNAVWILNSSDSEVLTLNAPGHPVHYLPPDSQVAFNDLGGGGTITAQGSGGSMAEIEILPRAVSGCGTLASVDALEATVDCSTGDVFLCWTNAGAYGSVQVFRDNALVGAVPVGTESFVELGVPSGMYEYTVVAETNTNTVSTSQTVFVGSYGGAAHAILQLEGRETSGDVGEIDSGAALEAQLLTLGVAPERYSLTPAEFLPCLLSGSVEAIWVTAGTFPNNYTLTPEDGAALAAASDAGIGVYFEGADHWGMTHSPSDFDARDGVDDVIHNDPVANGDNSLTSLDGFDSGLGVDFSGLNDQSYSQDSPLGADDTTDRLVVAVADAGVANAATIWQRDDALGAPYVTGIVADQLAGGTVVVQSWELGGLAMAANQLQVVSTYLDALDPPSPGTDFTRGDSNGDGGVNIADAIYYLGAIFPGPSGPNFLNCESASDSNDDGSLNIADAVSTLAVLFPTGPPIPFPEPVNCGLDPTPDSLTCSSTVCP